MDFSPGPSLVLSPPRGGAPVGALLGRKRRAAEMWGVPFDASAAGPSTIEEDVILASGAWGYGPKRTR